MIKFTIILINIFLVGCAHDPSSSGNLGYASASGKSSISSHGYQKVSLTSHRRHFDSAPREGWATAPILSYNMYSYYPMDFQYGGIYNAAFHPFSRMQ
jgi:hypothetical protein